MKSISTIAFMTAFVILLAMKEADVQSTSPVVVREMTTARFSWQIPSGESFINIFVLSPSGSTVLLANAASLIQTGPNYISRVTYTGDLSVKTMAFDLRDVVRSDAGTYTCGRNTPNDVIDDCGQKLIVLGIPTKPSIGRKSIPVFGSPMVLTCSSNSTTIPDDHGFSLTYTWQRDNRDVIFPSPGSPFTFTVTSRNPHRYRCRATESQSVQSEWSSAHVLQPEYSPFNVSLQPPARSYTKTEDEESVPSITCSAGCRPGCTYSWYKDGTVFTSGATLNLGLAKRSQAGSYRCQAENKHGKFWGTIIMVDILYLPTIVMMTINNIASSATVNQHESIIFRCEVDSNPKSTIKFMRGSIELSRIENSHLFEYNITSKCRQTGNYSCVARNIVGRSVEETTNVSLFVRCSPRLDAAYPTTDPQISALGSTVVLSVTLLSYPQPYAYWTKTNSIDTKNLTTTSVMSVSDNYVTVSLTLDRVRVEDYGYYLIQAANGVGDVSLINVRLVSPGPPSHPSNVTVNSIGPRTLSVRWRQGFNGGDNQTFSVEYSTDGQIWRDVGVLGETRKDEYLLMSISNLTPLTVYYVRVTAVNYYGSSHVVKISRTEQDIPLGLIIGLGAVGLLLICVVACLVIFRRKGYTCSIIKPVKADCTGTYAEVEDNSTTIAQNYTGLNRLQESVPTYEDIRSKSATKEESEDATGYENTNHL